jgi:hypothetical protein
MITTILFFFHVTQTQLPPATVREVNTNKTAEKQRFDFEDDVVVGERDMPLYETIRERPKTKFGSLIPIRENFNNELMKSVYDL